MSAMQAALGWAQLQRVDELVERKRQIFAWYQQRLDGIAGLTLNHEPPHVRNSYWMVTAVLDRQFGLNKNTLASLLAESGIDTRPFFHPLSSLPAFRNDAQAIAAAARNHVAYRISPFGINLPSALTLTEEQVDRACECLSRCLRQRALGAAAA